MASPDWTLLAASVALLTLVLLVLSRSSARAIAAGERPATAVAGQDRGPPVPTGAALLANVVLTHGLLFVVLVGLLWYAGIPRSAVGAEAWSTRGLALGLGLGVGLYLASETSAALADRLGVEYDERLRELLAPDGPVEWALLLLVVLPVIAGAEELLFRGVLVGAIGSGFGLHPLVLVVGSSVLFGLGHSAQGGAGVAVTAALGLVLGAAFVLTGSLAVVVVAHYAVDVLEFVVREGVAGRRTD